MDPEIKRKFDELEKKIDKIQRTRQFVNYLNRVKAEAPAKFKAVAEAFEKISWM